MAKKHLSKFDSRQYMVNDNFEIYYYENTFLTGIEHHTHNYYEFYFFVEGKISMAINNITYSLKHGDVILIPPNTPHHIINHDPSIPYRRFVFWLDRDYYKSIKSFSSDFSYIIDFTRKNKQYIYPNDVISFNSIQTKLLRLIEETHSYRFGKTTKISICVYDLMHHLNRMAHEIHHPETPKVNHRIHANIITYIENHLDEELTLDSIADTFYVSKYHIAHVFKENYGISVHKYITKKRLEMCRSALMKNVNITEVFHKYGFKDYSSFYRAFKKEFGYSPKEYKEIHTKQTY